MASHDRVKVAVLGASGYAGIEAVRILAGHPFVELSALTSEHYAGREVAEVYQGVAGQYASLALIVGIMMGIQCSKPYMWIIESI